MSGRVYNAERIFARHRALSRALLRLCSHIRKTWTPRCFNALDTYRARRRFPSIFFLQYLLFCFGKRRQSGHPCQKQPSTKIAILFFENQKSGHPITESGCMRQPRTRMPTKENRNATSVERLPVERTFDIRMLRSFFVRLSISELGQIL